MELSNDFIPNSHYIMTINIDDCHERQLWSTSFMKSPTEIPSWTATTINVSYRKGGELWYPIRTRLTSRCSTRIYSSIHVIFSSKRCYAHTGCLCNIDKSKGPQNTKRLDPDHRTFLFSDRWDPPSEGAVIHSFWQSTARSSTLKLLTKCRSRAALKNLAAGWSWLSIAKSYVKMCIFGLILSSHKLLLDIQCCLSESAFVNLALHESSWHF